MSTDKTRNSGVTKLGVMSAMLFAVAVLVLVVTGYRADAAPLTLPEWQYWIGWVLLALASASGVSALLLAARGHRDGDAR